MIDSVVKGRRNERRCKADLVEAGWLVTTSKNNSRFSLERDYFSCFDAIAVRNGKVLFVQVKSNVADSFDRSKILQFAIANKVHAEIWIRVDRVKEWNKIVYDYSI